MAAPLREVSISELSALKRSHFLLREALEAALDGGARETPDAIRKAIKSAEGAVRHAKRARAAGRAEDAAIAEHCRGSQSAVIA